MSNKTYEHEHLDQVAFPLGGIGAGMFCIEGAGALSKVSLWHQPNLINEPIVFAALSLKNSNGQARILEGPVPRRKLFPQFSGIGLPPRAGVTFGLPRFREAAFKASFPFATIHLLDPEFPVDVEMTGWSPFLPGDADSSSLPVGAIEYKFTNRTQSAIEAVFSFNSENFMAHREDPFQPQAGERVLPTTGGFVLHGPGGSTNPWDAGDCAMWVSEPHAETNHVWFGGALGAFFDSIEMLWRDICSGNARINNPKDSPSIGGSVFVPVALERGQTKIISVRLAWYVPRSNAFAPNFDVTEGKITAKAVPAETYVPWYAAHFSSIDDVKSYWDLHYLTLRAASEKFARTFHDSTLPAEVQEAVSANLTILKSPTVLRQSDGRLWAWEGCGDVSPAGGPGSCTHVWNYAQAVPHLFPELERSLRETEFGPNQGSDGYQSSRASLPIGPIGDEKKDRVFLAVGDGQPGGIVKTYRDWRISGDTEWLRRLWPSVRASLDYCIATWDPKERGWLEEPHQTTYDIRFWGPDSFCATVYLGALKAATLMGQALGDDVSGYSKLLSVGAHRVEEELFDGEYFIQKTNWDDLRATFPPEEDGWITFYRSPEGLALAKEEGPPYQYGKGCLADGVFGAWLCLVSGIDEVVDRQKVLSHLAAVYRHNFKTKLTNWPRVGRSTLASPDEAGLLLCTWPKGGRPSMPLIYADEIWTGIEYQVASHLIAAGLVDQGLDIVRGVRRRYDGKTRNPFAEAEAGQWYARAMSSYALLQALSGARYDAVERVLYLNPAIKGDFRSFLATATGYGTVGVKEGKPFLEVVSGEIPCKRIEYSPRKLKRLDSL